MQSSIKTDWVPRKEQNDIVEKFKKFMNRDKKFLFIEAPTGIGKSYSVVLMSAIFEEQFGVGNKFDVITNTKMLQDQYLKDFDFIKSIKGSDNYRCHKHNCTCSEGGEINLIKKTSCNPCSYKVAKDLFTNSTIGLTNFHMFINLLMHNPEVITGRSSKVLFVDEAHLFEETYCDFIDAFVSKEYLEENEVWDDNLHVDLLSVSDFKSFSNLLSRVNGLITNKVIQLLDEMGYEQTPSQIILANKIKHLKRMSCKYNRFICDEKRWKSNWSLQIEQDSKGVNKIKAEAVWASPYLEELWSGYEKIVFLSGTLIDRNFFMNLMGCEREQSDFMSLDSPFPVENRLIKFVNVGRMSYDRKHEVFADMVPVLSKILEKHKDSKGIIHTGNYELSSWVKEAINDDRLLFHDSKTRESVINRHITTDEKTVIVSPSMINGVDFKDELSRFQVILKVPFPNLSNERVKMRMEQNKTWYSWKTLCDIIQSYGRSVRSVEDYAETYILDGNFENVLRNINIPLYLKEAIKKVDKI